MAIAYQSDQGVATITIDRPEKKNAITGDMYDALVASLKRAADDKSVRAVLITGAGTAFTAGNDLKDFSNPRFIEPDSPVLGFMHALAAFEKPVVAAVNGLAVGIGVTLLLHCDLVYVADNATFSMPFTSLGLVPEFASTLLLPLVAGRVRAAEKLLLVRPNMAPMHCHPFHFHPHREEIIYVIYGRAEQWVGEHVGCECERDYQRSERSKPML